MAVALNNTEQVEAIKTIELDSLPADATNGTLVAEGSDEVAVAEDNTEQVGVIQPIELDSLPADATSDTLSAEGK